MNITIRNRRIFGTIAALAFTAAALSGCVYYPNRYAYNGYGGYGYGGGYYAAAPAVVVAPAPVVVGGWGWGGGWHGHGCCWR